MSRTIEQVQRDFAAQCQIAGHTQYQISVLQEDLVRMNAKISELNKEAIAMQPKQTEAADEPK